MEEHCDILISKFRNHFLLLGQDRNISHILDSPTEKYIIFFEDTYILYDAKSEKLEDCFEHPIDDFQITNGYFENIWDISKYDMKSIRLTIPVPALKEPINFPNLKNIGLNTGSDLNTIQHLNAQKLTSIMLCYGIYDIKALDFSHLKSLETIQFMFSNIYNSELYKEYEKIGISMSFGGCHIYS